MRTILITIISLGVLFSCKKEEFSETVPTPDVVNIAPEIPNLVFPANNQTCTHTNIEFNWGASLDANGDVLAYQIDVALEASFATKLFSEFTSEQKGTFTLNKGTTYYWRVRAIDSKQAESGYSAVSSFFTEPDAVVNTLPYSPEIVAPLMGSTATIGTVTLDWTAIDADGDAVVFDVYFGTSNPPVLVVQDVTISNYNVTVSSNTTYYWKIVAKDSKQGVAISPVWNFKTN